ncbi:MAG: hypothetical protein LBT86_10255 [Deltaproteobacteria bacterium]|jgi:hypothetical protein|nr:hypothetical protein [Deltaproteobacteria bacterium]
MSETTLSETSLSETKASLFDIVEGKDAQALASLRDQTSEWVWKLKAIEAKGLPLELFPRTQNLRLASEAALAILDQLKAKADWAV